MMNSFRRRGVLAGLLSFAAGPVPALAAGAAGPFSDQTVRDIAKARSASPWRPPTRTSAAARSLSYDDYRQLRFRTDRWLWAGQDLPFAANFFPAAYSADRLVELHLVENGQAAPLSFDPSLYDLPPGMDPAMLEGYSGFRLMSPINQPGVWDEIGAFQGASYFRSLGRDQNYGLSARGLAIGTGDRGEEFPDFVAWWLERPASGAASVVVHGLLDSSSCTGAYRFEITPGANTVFEVAATIYPRRTMDNAGVAPASSMFLFDLADPQDVRGRIRDYRSGVHDSDGLAIWTGDGRRLWRPLGNPRGVRLSSFPDANPRGFGLMQRKRDFESYGDLEAHYHRRPSLWVEPLKAFGAGAVYLLEFQTLIETDDNVACFWRPATPWTAGEPVDLAYRLHFGVEPYPAQQARAVRTRSGWQGGTALFAVDFAGVPGADPAALQLRIEASTGEVEWPHLVAHADPGVVRATFGLKPAGAADLSLTLMGEGGPVSETWLSRFDG